MGSLERVEEEVMTNHWTQMFDNIPQSGDFLKQADYEMIVDAIEARRLNNPEEDFRTAVMVVLLNIGERYTIVDCMNGEWSGLKKDLPHSDGIPKCPNGHVLFEGSGLKLAWIRNRVPKGE